MSGADGPRSSAALKTHGDIVNTPADDLLAINGVEDFF